MTKQINDIYCNCSIEGDKLTYSPYTGAELVFRMMYVDGYKPRWNLVEAIITKDFKPRWDLIEHIAVEELQHNFEEPYKIVEKLEEEEDTFYGCSTIEWEYKG